MPRTLPQRIEQLANEYLEAWMEDGLMGTYYAIEGARHDQAITHWRARRLAGKEDVARASKASRPYRDRQPRLGDLWAIKRTAGERGEHPHLSR